MELSGNAMKTLRILFLLAALALVPGSWVSGDLAAQDDDEDLAPPAVNLPKLNSSDTEAIMARIGERVVVSGDVADTREWEGGITFINFVGSEFTTVCFKANYGRFGEPRPAERYRGKRLTIVGIIGLQKGVPQIELEGPTQVVSATPLEPAKGE